MAIALEAGEGDEELMAFTQFLGRGEGLAVNHRASVDEPLVQLHTSGTTGKPKGVVLSHRSLLQQRYQARDAGEHWALWDDRDVSLLAMPVFHVSGTGWGNFGMFAGARSVIVREFDPASVLGYIRDCRVSRLFLVPSAIKILLDDPASADADFSSLRGIIYGSSPIPDDQLVRALDRSDQRYGAGAASRRNRLGTREQLLSCRG